MPLNHTRSLKGFLHQYQIVLKDKIYMYLIIGSSILIMGELSTSSYISIRLNRNLRRFLISYPYRWGENVLYFNYDEYDCSYSTHVFYF